MKQEVKKLLILNLPYLLFLSGSLIKWARLSVYPRRGRKRKAATSWGRFYHRLFQYRAELPPGRLSFRHCGGGHCPADYLHQRQEREEIPPRDRIRFGALGRG